MGNFVAFRPVIPESEYGQWFASALKVGRSEAGNWTEIKPGSIADKAWQRYFDDIGWRPVAAGLGRCYTVPVALPSDLPAGFEPFGPKQRRWNVENA